MYEDRVIAWDVDIPMEPEEVKKPRASAKKKPGLSRKEMRDLIMDRPLWTVDNDPFRPAVCRPESSRRFRALLERDVCKPNYDRVKVKGVPITLDRGAAHRRASVTLGESSVGY